MKRTEPIDTTTLVLELTHEDGNWHILDDDCEKVINIKNVRKINIESKTKRYTFARLRVEDKDWQ